MRVTCGVEKISSSAGLSRRSSRSWVRRACRMYRSRGGPCDPRTQNRRSRDPASTTSTRPLKACTPTKRRANWADLAKSHSRSSCQTATSSSSTGSKSAAATSRRSTISSRPPVQRLPWGRLLLYSVPSGVTELLVRGIEAGHQQRLLMLPPGLADSPWRDSHMRPRGAKRQGRWGRNRQHGCSHSRRQVGDAGIVADVERGLRQPAGQLVQVVEAMRVQERRSSGRRTSGPASFAPARAPAGESFRGPVLARLPEKG